MMISTELLVDSIMRVLPEFEYQCGRPHKLVTNNIMTNYQSKILSVLQHIPVMSMSELANRLVMQKPQLSANVDVLVRLGLVDRVTDADDRRRVLVQLSDKGHLCMEDTKKKMAKYYDMYYGNITQEERIKIFSAIETMIEIFEKLSPFAHEIDESKIEKVTL